MTICKTKQNVPGTNVVPSSVRSYAEQFYHLSTRGDGARPLNFQEMNVSMESYDHPHCVHVQSSSETRS